jgi:hypothetical protein
MAPPSYRCLYFVFGCVCVLTVCRCVSVSMFLCVFVSMLSFFTDILNDDKHNVATSVCLCVNAFIFHGHTE